MKNENAQKRSQFIRARVKKAKAEGRSAQKEMEKLSRQLFLALSTIYNIVHDVRRDERYQRKLMEGANSVTSNRVK